MKKIIFKLITLICVIALAVTVFAACGGNGGGNQTGGGNGGGNPTGGGGSEDIVDYVSQLKLDMNSETNKQEVTVKFYIDGDTTHFTPKSNSSDFVDGYIKARYLAVNTPESTGVVEKWGKTASNFTHEKLENAQKIIVESDDDKWNLDSNGRYLLWIWYMPKDGDEYRNLNVELLQEGYGRSSKTSDNRYGEIAGAALFQAQQLKLNVFSNKSDPNYFGKAGENLTLKYLRFHIDDYLQKPVRVTGIVTARYGNSVYIEEYDEETEISYGIAVYYGYKTGQLLDILRVGNKVDVMGTVGEFNGTYQISDVDYNEVRPTLSTNTQLISENNPVPCTEVSVADLTGSTNRKVTATFYKTGEDDEETEEEITIDYGKAIMDTHVSIKDLSIDEMYTTKKEDSSGNRIPTGQISITCSDANQNSFVVRTEPMYKDGGTTLYAEADFQGKSISYVHGIVDYYSTDDAYQLSVWDYSCFTFAQ